MKKYILILIAALFALQACEDGGGNNTKGIAEINGDVDDLTIYWDGGTVTVAYANTNYVRFYEKSTTDLVESNSLSCRYQNNELEIYFGPDGSVEAGDLDKDLYVLIPASYSPDNITIVTTDASVDVDIDSEKASITTDTGDILYSNCMNPFKATLTSISGNIGVELLSTSSFVLDWRTGSGEFTNTDFSFVDYLGMYKYGTGDSQLNVRTVSGNLVLAQRSN